MGSCCDMWNAKPFYCNSFKLRELAAPHYVRCLLEADSALEACARVTARVVWADRVSTYLSRKAWVRLRLKENRKKRKTRISTHLDQCQVFQIESEEMISVKEWDVWVNGSISSFLFYKYTLLHCQLATMSIMQLRPWQLKMCYAFVVLSC